jgi:hypothetical protein
VTLKITVLGYMTLCSLVETYISKEYTASIFRALKLEAACSSEMSVNLYHSTSNLDCILIKELINALDAQNNITPIRHDT